MVDDDPRQPLEQVRVTGADLADPLEGTAIGDDHEVVVGLGVRVQPEPLDAGHEVVQRRDRVGADRVGAATHRLDQLRHGERRAERVGIRVLVADGQHPPCAAQPVHDDLRDGVEIRAEIDAHVARRRGVLCEDLCAVE